MTTVSKGAVPARGFLTGMAQPVTFCRQTASSPLTALGGIDSARAGGGALPGDYVHHPVLGEPHDYRNYKLQMRGTH